MVGHQVLALVIEVRILVPELYTEDLVIEVFTRSDDRANPCPRANSDHLVIGVVFW
jgi:hypothetical protein